VWSGRVTIRGTANHGHFQFTKVEYSQGEEPSHWNVETPSILAGACGQLEELDTTGCPTEYWLQLTVVDQRALSTTLPGAL
jgi:hypothetical protein